MFDERLYPIPQTAGLQVPETAETPTSATFFRSNATFNAAVVGSNNAFPPPSADLLQLPANPLRRPFHLMRTIRATMTTGGFVTERLYLPPQMWLQGGAKLLAVEAKVRMIELLLTGLDAVERTGSIFVEPSNQGSQQFASGSEVAMNADKFAKELESFEGLLDGIQSTLNKKLGSLIDGVGKRNGQSSFGSWSSKLSRSIDRMTNGKSLDSPSVYVEALSRVLLHGQIIDRHIACLIGEQPSTYPSIGRIEKQRIEMRLKRSSEFFGQVLCRFLVHDIGLLVDKYVKKGGSWCAEN
ncbi:hypothetical protein BT69DRAFT_1224211 [Atractiella rhizophila]|nr:hypothetical protein BT69DRAFT_1224211 [Atractiella rhizophila]